MNTHALIPLVATIAYIPLFVILLANRPWQRQQRLFFLFLVAAMLWSFTDSLGRSDWFMQYKLILVKVVLCNGIWMLVQFHYFLHSSYDGRSVRIPFAYAALISVIILSVLGYIPQSIAITPAGINVDYGTWFVLSGLLIAPFLIKDMYFLIRRHRITTSPQERNQIVYLLLAIAVLIILNLASLTTTAGKYPVGHIGNFATACILTYPIVSHHLLDIRVVLRRGLMYAGIYIAGIAIVVILLFLASLAFHFTIDLPTFGAAVGIGLPIIVVFVHMVRPRWQRRVERGFTREKYDYRRQLSHFVTGVHTASSLEDFSNQFVSLLAQSVDCHRACLLLPGAENGDFTARFVYSPAKNDAMTKLKLRQDSPIVAWLKSEARMLPERSLSILSGLQSMWREEKETIHAANIEMFFPLVNNDKLIGVLALGKKEDNGFYTVEDIDLVESIAKRIAAAIEKEYLHEQLQEQDKELAAVNRLTSIIISSMNLEETFDGFTAELRKVLDVDYAAVELIEGDRVRLVATSSQLGPVRQVGDMVPLKGTTTEWVVQHKQSIYEANLAQSNKLPNADDYINKGIHAIAYLPLAIKDRCIGSLVVASRSPDAYNARQIGFLQHLALQVAMPIENCALYAKVEQQSRIDELTGLFNRRHLEERIQEEIARHSRYGGVFTLLMLDLDSFKTYNDIYGHSAGDQILSEIGTIIKSSIRSADQAFRYGGDEFAIILPVTTIDNACTVAERVRQNIATQMGAKQIGVTCSIGLSSYPSDGVMLGELVNAADTAIYYAKRTGGNRVYLSSRILSEPPPAAGINARNSGLGAIYALASAVEARDLYTYGHSKKVNTYAIALAEAAGLPPDRISNLSAAALLHDIGKVGIPDKVLNKKGQFTAADWDIMKTHPRLGANIVGNVPNLIPSTPAILYHHERYDGTGYPEGLKGDNIPLEARILSIADAFDAMTSARHYRSALSRDKAIKELKNGAGTQFDPSLVEIFIGVVQSGLPQGVEADETPSV